MAQFLDKDREDLPDPFSRERSVHPALGNPYHVSSDIYTPLFDKFLDNQVFDRWLRRMNTWQLHFLGSPGAGKVNSRGVFSSVRLLISPDNDCRLDH